MKRNTVLIISLFICMFVTKNNSFGSDQAKENLCAHESDKFQCLKTNARGLYHSNYDLFWDILHAETKKIKKSTNLHDIKNYLELSEPIGGNSEVTGYYSSVVAELTISKTFPTLDAMNMLEDKYLKLVVFYLHNSNEPDQIDSMLNQHKNNPKYNKVLSMYFEGYEKILEEMFKQKP